MKEETHRDYLEPDCPAGVALVDQAHAEAIERLRGAKMWALVVLEEPDEEATGQARVMTGGGGTLMDLSVLCVALGSAHRAAQAKVVGAVSRLGEDDA